VSATLDATRTGSPITPLVFGGFMEPATTRVWAVMLSVRKFFNRVMSRPDPAAVTGGFGRRGRQWRWRPVGRPDAKASVSLIWGRGPADRQTPATIAESSLAEAPPRIKLPPASLTPDEFAVR
jgi:hypothetical protein